MPANIAVSVSNTFVRLVLTQDNELDQASQDAYGVPFATVDRACVKWVRQQVL